MNYGVRSGEYELWDVIWRVRTMGCGLASMNYGVRGFSGFRGVPGVSRDFVEFRGIPWSFTGFRGVSQ
ncbi:hypothetical protein RRG08_014477 [Elysia crispata]|uniref:Uncharacterized protein n=1 Tax=Elysia crispata TaxID=231223 RepID=A0AAE0YDH1_9GAST|nr:hypothetical protein RRG08_014477 [Elysia crispata]